MTVLLADDDDAVRRFTRRVLEGRGHNVVEAEDAMHALELATAHNGPIDLLVTDVIMPGLNGFELAARLVQMRPDVVILFISGYMESTMVLARHPPAVVLQKPFSPEQLIRAVQTLCGSE